MKKCLSLILAFVMMLTMLPMGVLAAETTSTDIEDLDELARKIFPEYIPNMEYSASRSMRTASDVVDSKVVISETRPISDNRSLNYTQFSSGSVLLTESNFIVNDSLDSITQGTVLIYTYSFRVKRYSSAGEFNITNFKHQLVPNGYDSITSSGTLSNNYFSNCSLNHLTANETASAPAKAIYDLKFNIGDHSGSGAQFFQGILTINVRNNTLTYEKSEY